MKRNSNKGMQRSRSLLFIIICMISAVGLFMLNGCADSEEIATEVSGSEISTESTAATGGNEAVRTVDNIEDAVDFEIPEYTGQPSVTVNDNVPIFDDALKTEKSFESYGKLDKHGRCTTALANLSIELQPSANEERGDISAIHPTGWMSDQGWERCHLIGWQLAGENDNPNNLITGTHYLNVDGMLPYENEVNTYITETGNHVLYEVTPIFEGNNMICSGVHMQAESVEDEGKGVSYNVFCFNVKPGYEINYKTGATAITDEELAAQQSFERGYVLNTNTMRFHYPSCSSVNQMADHNKEFVTTSREELMKAGYLPCGNCEP